MITSGREAPAESFLGQKPECETGVKQLEPRRRISAVSVNRELGLLY
jgi:hypothetical protein